MTVGSIPLPVSLVDPATTPGVQPNGQSSGWTLLQSEEFGGTIATVDSALGHIRFRPDGPTWGTWYPLGASPENPHTNNYGREKQWYDPSGVSLASGTCRLTATRDFVHNDVGLDYTSGLIQANPSCNFLYGFMEARIRCSKIAGTWPAFWAIPASYDWPPEIDMLEQYGTQNYATLSTWINNSSGNNGTYAGFQVAVDPGQWHTYAVRWTSTALTFYVDGTQVAQETNVAAVPQEPMYVVANLAVDGNQTINTAAFPTFTEVDYIRVWQ